MVALLVFVALVLSSSLARQPQYEVLVILPDARVSEWSVESGDLQHAIQLAQQSVYSLSFPFDFTVKTLEVDSSSVSLAQLVHELIHNEERLTVAVVGFFCKRTLQELELIGVGGRERLGLVQISVNTFLPVAGGSSRPYYYQMFPSSLAYAEALTQLMEHVGWTRVGVAFTEHQDSYYYEIYQQVIGALNKHGHDDSIFKVTNDIEALREHSVMQAIRSIHVSGVKIVNVLLPPLETAMLICGAYDYGLRWPEYGWIVPGINLANVSLERGVICDSNALHGIIYFWTVLSHNATRLKEVSSQVQIPLETSLRNSNIHTRAIYDSILATALSLNITFSQVKDFLNSGESKNSFHLQSYRNRAQRRVSHMIGEVLSSGVSFMGALGKTTFNRSSGPAVETNISIFRTIHGKSSKIGAYNPMSNTSHYVVPKAPIPSDKLARIYSRLPVSLEGLLTTCMAICFLIAVVNLTLYMYYRNTPEIKSSSFRLSMVIHVSSIIMMIGGQFYISISAVAIDKSYGKVVCTLLNWLIYPWGDIILATLLVKISRIKYIFSHSQGKINMKLCSDTTLLLVIALVFAGKVLILSLWTSLDVFTNTDVEIYHLETKPPYYEVEQHCLSRYYFLWLCTSLGYTGILGAVLGCAVFRARNIRHKDFNDTKKINMTVVVCFVTVGIVVPMWWTFRAAGNTNASTTLLALLYMILPMSCQTCLFLPKTIPPLMRSISASNVLKESGGNFPQVKRRLSERFISSQVSQMRFSNPSNTTSMSMSTS